MEPGVRGPRRDREDRPERNDGPEPEFAPAFLTRDDD
jgi:polyribonucleotide nucleotidyltransferase